MWAIELSIAGLVVLALMLTGMWIPFAVGIAGLIIIWLEAGTNGFRALGLISWSTLSSFTLTALPLFILMAEILSNAGLGSRFYNGTALLVRRLPGGLLQTNILGSALFASICGSSAATAATIGTVALPQLDARGYDPKLSCGSLAAGGTLGILIPPSLTMIIYGTITEVSIAKLFMAGVLPGALLAGLFSVYVGARAVISPQIAPREDTPADPAEIRRALFDLVPFLGLIFMVLGTIYFGIATPTESAALGCVLAFAIAAVSGGLSRAVLMRALQRTVETSATLLFIILGAFFFGYGIELGGIGTSLVEFISGLGFDAFTFLLILMGVYIILGCFLDGAGMIVLTVPLLLPVLEALQVDLVWFGIFVVVMLEMGMLTPPFGLNLFVVQGISRWGLGIIVAGTVPFVLIMMGFMVLLMIFPEVALWLPSRM
ncbi:MAG: TRAP transporter large permease subunit [Alphaproteobacteria bacterium]